MENDLALPESDSAVLLSKTELRVLGVVLEFWPVCPLDIAHHFGEDVSSRESKKKASSKYSYYLQKLMDKRVVLGKRMGNGLVAWPLVVEKYRTIHNILRE